MRKSEIKKFTVPAAVAGMCACAAVYLTVQNTWIQVEHFEIDKAAGESRQFQIVQLSDLHLPKTAGKIDKIVRLARNQSPDLIVLTGDLVDTPANLETCGLSGFCQRLREVAPVYAVTGNHEFKNGNTELWAEILRRNGVIIVDDTYAIFEKNGSKLAVMGLSNAMPYDMDLFEDIEDIADMPKILLAHQPQLFETYASEDDAVRPDLVFSGHAHGGQVRLPLVGGLLAPGQGFFPRYTSGRYDSQEGTSMIVSRGIGGSEFPFRINNRPHMPVVTLSVSAFTNKKASDEDNNLDGSGVWHEGQAQPDR